MDPDPRPRLLRAKELADLLQDLRQGDYRLVRLSPTKETIINQYKYCPSMMKSLLMTLCTSTNTPSTPTARRAVSLHVRGLAAEALAACMTDQPKFQDLAQNNYFLHEVEGELNAIQHHQLAAHSLADGLTLLLKESLEHYQSTDGGGAAVVAASQAAEAVYMSSYHHPGHLADYLYHDTISVLAEWIVSTSPWPLMSNATDAEDDGNSTFNTKRQTVSYPFHPARAVVWSSAALENLAASYCANDLGFCILEWKTRVEIETPEGATSLPQEEVAHDNTDAICISGSPNIEESNIGVATLVLDEKTPLEAPELTEQARQKIAAYPNLLFTLAAWICSGPIDHVATQTYGWPGDVQLWKDGTLNAASPHFVSPSIIPWAAAGVIKNLLLSKSSSDDLETANSIREQIKSIPRLHQSLCEMRWSPDWLEYEKASAALRFWSSTPEGNCPVSVCEDQDWYHEDGGTCKDYYINRWCVEYGDAVGTNGKSAKEACCVCGGGHRENVA